MATYEIDALLVTEKGVQINNSYSTDITGQVEMVSGDTVIFRTKNIGTLILAVLCVPGEKDTVKVTIKGGDSVFSKKKDLTITITDGNRLILIPKDKYLTMNGSGKNTIQISISLVRNGTQKKFLSLLEIPD